MKQWLLIGVLALVVGLPAARANIYNFNYTGSGVVASGTLWTTNNANGEAIYKITGTRNGYAINGLVDTTPPPGTLTCCGQYWSYDNLLVDHGPQYFNWNGLLYSEAKYRPTDVNLDGTNPLLFEATRQVAFNVYYDNGHVIEDNLTGSIADDAVRKNQVDFHLSAAPEPGFYGVLALGLGGLFVGVRRRRRA